MKTIGRFFVFALLVHAACATSLQAAGTALDAAGYWKGSVVLPTAPLAIQVDLTRGGDQSWQGTIDIPAQGLRGFALNRLKIDGVAVSFGMPGVPGDPLFVGQLSADLRTISGEFAQGGQKFPFKLERSTRAPAVQEAPGVAGKGIVGRWQGTLKPAPGVELRLALEIAETGTGQHSGVLISLDQGSPRIPLTTITENADAIRLESASIGGVFDGKLNADGSETAGIWSQGGHVTPLTFRRLAAEPNASEPGPAKAPSQTDAALPKSFHWLVLSPIPVLPAGSAGQPDEAAQKKAFTSDLLSTQGGETQVVPKRGEKVSIDGVSLEWKAIEPVDGSISLNSAEQKENFNVAYAATEFEVPSDTRAWLGIGSDDGVRVWLNGVLIHEHWIGRVLQVDDDVVSVALKAGQNRLLIKVQNITGSWGFAARLMDAKARAERLVSAARTGDVDALKDLTGRGFEVNGRTSEGLTPYLAARMAGQKDTAEFLAAHGADTQVTLPSPEALVDKLLNSRIDANGAGAAILVARHGKILYKKAFGLADIERRLPVTVDTKFRIGSITKQFTASAILRLQEAGKLKITDPLSKYYPDFPRGGDLTLERLLTHTSGIHSYTDSAAFLQTVTHPTTTADVIASIKKFPADFKPGERWSYSNSGYFILGDIVEKVSGRKYGEFLGETFFAPLGMTGTGVYQNDQPPAGAAVGYEYQDGHFKKALDWNMTWAGGAGWIYSTVEDLYRWNEAVFGGKILEKDDLAAAFTPVVTEENKKDKSTDGYGFGWGITHFRGALEISHGGGLHGFLSNLLRLPEQEFTVVVLVNDSPPKPMTDPGTLSQEIVEYYVGSELAPRSKAAVQEAKAVPSSALAAIVGRYDYRGAILVVTQEGDHAYAQLGGQPRFEIFPKSETEFFWKVVDAQVTFEKDASGKVVGAIHHQNGQTLHAPRLEPVAEVKLTDAQTDPLLGDYDFKPVGRATITRDGGRLFCQLTGQPKLELGATSDTQFFVRAVNAQLTFVKGQDGKPTKLVLHQGGQDVEMPRLVQP